jgi:O-antigen/teichoic acid export membrane protein
MIGAGITVAVNVIFIPTYGYVASAWAHLICYSVMVLLSYGWSRKHYPIPYKTGRILLYVFIALLLYTSNQLFLQGSGVWLDVLSMLLLVFYLGVVGILERPTLLKYKTENR